MSTNTSTTSTSGHNQKNNPPSTTKTNSNNQRTNSPPATKANTNNQKSVPSQTGRKSSQNSPKKSSAAPSPKKGRTSGRETPIEFQFDFDKSTKEQILAALEKSQQEEDDQPLLSAQHSQSETNYDVKKLAESPIVKAFNEAERRRLSKPKK